MCRDKSRVDRICEGDSNTRFFHISVTIRRVSNRIMCLKDEVGNENSEPGNIKDHILIFHRKLYSTEQVSCPDLPLHMEGPLDLIRINHIPTHDEIRTALFSMKPMKTPGPDGFHLIFFAENLGYPRERCLQGYLCLVRGGGDISDNLNEALICLIPKQPCAETIKQLRPISLCNTLYTLVTKIPVTRLKHLIPAWISGYQNSFIKGRGADINLVVASEILHSINRKKGKWGWFVLKIYLEKAYDRVEWSFVRECLLDCQLNLDFVNFIMDCVSKASSTVFMNGRQFYTFSHSRGLC